MPDQVRRLLHRLTRVGVETQCIAVRLFLGYQARGCGEAVVRNIPEVRAIIRLDNRID